MTPAVSAVRWLVSGRVQGVGFRWHTLRRASGLGLEGWVCNLSDGRVEVVARGSAELLAALESWLRSGPGMARVEGVEKSDVPHEQITRNQFHVK